MKLRNAEFQQLSKEKKVEYIWDYYKFHILIALVAVISVISIVANAANSKRVSVYCLIFNDTDNPELAKALDEEYTLYIGDPKSRVLADCNFPFYIEPNGLVYPEDSTAMKVAAMLPAKQADVIIGNPDSFAFYSDNEIFLPLEECLSKELCSALSPYFVTLGDKPDALDISGTEFYKKHSESYSDALLAVTMSVNDPAEAERFIRFIFGM